MLKDTLSVQKDNASAPFLYLMRRIIRLDKQSFKIRLERRTARDSSRRRVDA